MLHTQIRLFRFQFIDRNNSAKAKELRFLLPHPQQTFVFRVCHTSITKNITHFVAFFNSYEAEFHYNDSILNKPLRLVFCTGKLYLSLPLHCEARQQLYCSS
jgi:hypothetical protein